MILFETDALLAQRCGSTKQQLEKIKSSDYYRQRADAFRSSAHQSFCNPDSTVIVPVVIHIVYNVNEPGENLSEEQIQSQIDAMNEDYAGENATMANIPSVWSSMRRDSRIRFALALRDPAGNASNGITRNTTLQSSFGPFSNVVKHYDSTGFGGANAWTSSSYLNIWVCNLDNVLGYATFPGTIPDEDGLVINYKAFGRKGDLLKKYSLGRTGTHEAGHWFQIVHIWGDDGGMCEFDTNGGSDGIDDTPDQSDATYGNPSFPKYDNCTPGDNGIMFTNYMDYSDDKAMIFFTPRQIEVMDSILQSAWRDSICISLGATAPFALKKDLETEQILSPVIQPDNRCFQPIVRIKNIGRDTATSFQLVYNIVNGVARAYSWSGTLLPDHSTDITLPSISGAEGINVLEVRIADRDSNNVNNYKSRSFKIAKEFTLGCEDANPVVYPNPATGNGFCVKSNFSESQKITIRVINMLGEKIYEQKDLESNPGDVFPVNPGIFIRGVYIVQLIGKDESRGTKVLFLPANPFNQLTNTCY